MEIQTNKIYRVKWLNESYCVWFEKTDEEGVYLVHDYYKKGIEPYIMYADEIIEYFDLIG